MNLLKNLKELLSFFTFFFYVKIVHICIDSQYCILLVQI